MSEHTSENSQQPTVPSDTARSVKSEKLRNVSVLNKNLLESIVLNSQDGIVVVAEGKYTYVNPALEKMLGLPAEKILGKPLGTFLSPQTAEKLQQRYTKRRNGTLREDPTIIGTTALPAKQQLVLEISIAQLHPDDPSSVVGTIRDITDLQQTRQEHYKTSQKMHWYTQNSPLGYIEWDEELRIKDWNNAASKIFGYPRSEAIGKNCLDLISPPQSTEQCTRVLENISKSTPGNHEFIAENNTKSGQIITCRWYNTPIRSQEGKTTGMISMVSDISQLLKDQNNRQTSLKILEVLNRHKKTPSTLKKIVSLIQQLSKTQTVSVILQSNNDTEYSRGTPEEQPNASTALCPVASLPEGTQPSEELLSSFVCKQIMDGLTTKTKKPYYTSFGSFWTNDFAKLRDQQTTLGLDHTPHFNDYSTIAIIPLKHSDQNIGLLYLADPTAGMLDKDDLATLEEIAVSLGFSIAHHNAELLIEENERFFSDLFRMTTAGLMLTKTDGTIIDINTELSNIIQLTPTEIKECNLKDLLTHDQQEFFKTFKNQIKENGCFGPVETEFKHSSKNIIPVRISGVKIIRDRKTYVWSTIVDMTQEKIASQQLKTAKEMAENASKAKSQFLANMSHEIRTPMNAVIGFTDLLRNTPLNKTQQEYVSTVYESAEKLISLINTILDVSKLETSQVSLENVEFDLEYLIVSMVKTILPQVKEKKLKIHHSFDEALPKHFRGDPTRIRQVILNLLSNAIKFTMQGEINITAVLKEKQHAGKIAVEITINDTGIGIDDQTLPEIFSPFTQADASSTRKFEGAGLGLYLANSLVKMMGGKMQATSKLGKGSSFFFQLPLSPVAHTKPSIQLLPLENLKGKTALIVESNLRTQRIMEQYCMDFGLKVTTVGTKTDSTLQTLKKSSTPPDLTLFSDDEFLASTEILDIPGFENTRTVFITPKAVPGSALQAQNKKVDAFLSSPLLKADLLATIQAVLNSPKQQGKSIITKHSIQERSYKKQMQALIVESSHINTRLLETILTKIGWTFDSVKNTEEAIKKATQSTHNVILLDLTAAGENIKEAARELKKATCLNIEIIGLSNAEPDKTKLAKAGISYTLPKPVKIADLQHTFAQLGLK